jgi:hypothetical protein
MSERHVGSPGYVGSGARIRRSGQSWKRGMAGGGDGSYVHSRNENLWISRMRWALPSVYPRFSFVDALLKKLAPYAQTLSIV